MGAGRGWQVSWQQSACSGHPHRRCNSAIEGERAGPPTEGRRALIDYLALRRRVLNRLGPEAAAVLDGRRPRTLDERVGVLLTDVTLGVHTHLLHRSHDGSIGCGRVMAAESRADRLALELLAPAAAVRAALERHVPSGHPDELAERTVELLVEVFGLPLAAATPYGRWLCQRWHGEPSVREWLGI
jgi:hypothetical protein